MADAVAGSAGARLPGRRRQETRTRLLRDGIAVDEALVSEIRTIDR
jgi:(2R)-3-sulfolactate dehydrogenase (NADP+)